MLDNERLAALLILDAENIIDVAVGQLARLQLCITAEEIRQCLYYIIDYSSGIVQFCLFSSFNALFIMMPGAGLRISAFLPGHIYLYQYLLCTFSAKHMTSLLSIFRPSSRTAVPLILPKT